MRTTRIAIVTLLLALLALLAGCAADEPDATATTTEAGAAQPTEDPGTPTPEPTQEATGEPTATATEAATAEPTATPGGEEPEPNAAEQVAIVDFAFEPAELEVATGTTVEWSQQGSSTHTVNFDDGDESGDLVQGDTYSRTFDEPGEYAYVCFFHPNMAATITVTE